MMAEVCNLQEASYLSLVRLVGEDGAMSVMLSVISDVSVMLNISSDNLLRNSFH